MVNNSENSHVNISDGELMCLGIHYIHFDILYYIFLDENTYRKHLSRRNKNLARELSKQKLIAQQYLEERNILEKKHFACLVLNLVYNLMNTLPSLFSYSSFYFRNTSQCTLNLWVKPNKHSHTVSLYRRMLDRYSNYSHRV